MIRVYLDDVEREVPTQVPHREVPDGVPIEVPPTSHAQVPAEDGRRELATAWVLTLLAPLAEANARQHETITAHAAQVADLREQRGRLTAELERATAALVGLHDEHARASRRARWLVSGLSLLLVGMTALLLILGTLAAAGWTR